MYFEPAKFIENLRYMGLGMLGVFLIIVIIIGATYLVSRLTGRGGSGKDDEQ